MSEQYVKKIKDNAKSRDLYGKVLSFDDSRYEVQWQISKNRTLTEWVDRNDCEIVEVVPVKINKVQFRKLAKQLRPAREGWQNYANCAGEDTSEFVYGADHPTGRLRVKLLNICRDCEVKIVCRREAVRLMEQGWWGGMDEEERREWAVKDLFS